MDLSLRDFASQVRPRPARPAPDVFDGSVFDAGSPQYIRPEDMLLDIQSQLFGIGRKSTKELDGVHPANFRGRWLRETQGKLLVTPVGDVSQKDMLEAIWEVAKCARRKNEEYPALLPINATLGHYKNIAKNLPSYWNDQLCPALSFADSDNFNERLQKFQSVLISKIDSKDRAEALSVALLPGKLEPREMPIHKVPYLRDYTANPPAPLKICSSLVEFLDILLVLVVRLPRVLWARWLTALFRNWLPLFFLKRCAVTHATALELHRVITQGEITPEKQLAQRLISDRALLRGSPEWLIQLQPIVQQYVRARLELSIALELSNINEWLISENNVNPANSEHKVIIGNLLRSVFGSNGQTGTLPSACGIFRGRKLSMPGDTGPDKLPLSKWLGWIVDQRPALDSLSCALGAEDFGDLINTAYDFLRPSYEPLKSGFGKNALEYVSYMLGAPRKRDRDPSFTDEFNLVIRGEGGRRARRISVQPGSELLIMIVQLIGFKAGYRLAKLSDLLELFDCIGIDFKSEPADFEILVSRLTELGLLESSADAAEAASLKPRYSFRSKELDD